MCCLLGFSEEFVAVFVVKLSHFDTENDKEPKIFQYRRFYAFFVKVSTDFVDWNVLKTQQGNDCLSNRLFRGDNCCFLNEKISN